MLYNYVPREPGFRLSGTPAESTYLYQQFARANRILPGSAEEVAHFARLATIEQGISVDVRHFEVQTTSPPLRALSPRRSSRIAQRVRQVVHPEKGEQMPELITPSVSPPVSTRVSSAT